MPRLLLLPLLMLALVVGCPTSEDETDDDDTTAADDDDTTATDDDDTTADDDDDDDDDDDATLPAPDMVVSVDRGAPQGALIPLLGVNRTPVIGGLQGDVFDFTTLYQWAGVTSVRAHDQGFDLCKVYTDDALHRSTNNEVLDADVCQYEPDGGDAAVWSVNNPATVLDSANYDFSEADSGIAAILDGGFELMLRLGESWDGPNDTTQPPMWTAVARRSYEHQATGWPGSLDVSGAPQWVEIHNEPDGRFWKGTTADFLSIYESTYDAVKGVTATGLVTPPVGGAGFTDGGTSAWLNGSTTLTLVGDFVTQVVSSRLDFLSVHYYGSCGGTPIEELADYLAAVRTTLDAEGGTGIPILLTEWNIGLGSACGNAFFGEEEVGSFVGAALTLMQDSALNIGGAWYYDGAPLMGPFTIDSANSGFIVRPAAFAYIAHSQLDGGTRLTATSCDAAGAGCVDVAGAISGGEPVLPLAVTLSAGEHAVTITNHGAAARLVQVDFDDDGPALMAYTIERPSATMKSVAGVTTGGTVRPTAAAMTALDEVLTEESGIPTDGRSVQVEVAPWEVLLVRVSE